ncbi:hypothetical protein [Streptomyces sp. WAC 06738]|uniref:hypothetical protein n=1 Tax=Streptomyces sp. WAC 06738 TaxID=2203210 RepID=UPI0013E0796A|nr:hypothetical protein [Streptomyces sp. WAC 06738]
MAEQRQAAGEPRESGHTELSSGPGRLILALYGVFAVGATSRAVYQLSTEFDEAPLAYVLSALAAVVYVFITVALARGGETARRLALVCITAELIGVLAIGTWTEVQPSEFPDQTVWSDYGRGYLFLPVILPVIGLWWLRKQSSRARPAAPSPE